jgi:hypothetical protein
MRLKPVAVTLTRIPSELIMMLRLGLGLGPGPVMVQRTVWR